MEKNNEVIDSMIILLETITDKKVDLTTELQNDPNFNNFLKNKRQSELGGHIPQKKIVENLNYSVSPDFAVKVIKPL